MATFMIFGEIGADEVRWEILDFNHKTKVLNNNNNSELNSLMPPGSLP